MSDLVKVRDLTYKIEEYEKQMDILNESYKAYCEGETTKGKVYLYCGSKENLSIDMCPEQVEVVVRALHSWYSNKVSEFKTEINNSLT